MDLTFPGGVFFCACRLSEVGGSSDLVSIHATGAGIEDVLIESALLVDFRWLARLYHPSLLQHIDLVGINDLSDVVRNDDYRASLLDGINRGLDLFGGDGIEAGRRFV